MKNIFLFIAGLFIVNLAMAQCIGGSISGGNSEICVGTTTGIMELNGANGTVSWWERSKDGGSFSVIGSLPTSLSEVLTTTGTYVYRVKVTNGGVECFSSTKTVVVKNAAGGTISSGGGAVCVDNTPTPLILTGHFIGPEGTLYWEYSTNGGSSYNIDGSGTNTNPYSPFLSNLGGTGNYMFRAKATCGMSASSNSSNTKTYQVSNPTAAAVCSDADDLRKAVAKVHISGIPYDFSGFLINHSSQDGRLLFLTTSHPFNRYAPSTAALNGATFTWNEDLSACNGSAATATTSQGCSILVTDGFFTLLQLNTAPDLAQLYYLGWDYNANASYNSIFQSAQSIKKGKVSTNGSPSSVAVGISNVDDAIVEGSGSSALKFNSWSAGNTEKRGRGAPLLTGKKVRGIYIGGTEIQCGNGPSYFATIEPSTTLMSYLRDGSENNTATVRMNYCKPYENLSGNVNGNITYSVTGSITSTQNIGNGYAVRYQAGSFVELNDGFVSGNDFIAEINPCIIYRTTIAAKTDDIDSYENSREYIINEIDYKITIYPTVLQSGRGINIVASTNLSNVEIVVYDLNGMLVSSNRIEELQNNIPSQILLPSLASGFYLVKVQSSTLSLTQKIIINEN